MTLINPFVFATGGGGGPTLLTADSFNRADGSLGSTDGAGSLDPLAWAETVGTGWVVNTNQVQRTGSGFGVASVDVGQADVSVELTVPVLGTTGNAGLAFRVTDSSNYWVWFFNGTTAENILGKVVGGTFSSVNTQAGKVAGDVLKIECSGNDIIRYRNGSVVGSTVSDSFSNTATRHGMWINNNTAWRLDDFSVSTL